MKNITDKIINKSLKTMKKTTFLAAACAIIALSSCNKENSQAAKSAEYITVSTNIGEITRVANNGSESIFEQGDKISVYSWTGTPTVVNSTALVVNNTVNTLQNGKWIAEPMMKWFDMITPHFFLSVYPVRTISNFTSDVVSVDPANQAMSSLLVAVNAGDLAIGLVATNNPVQLKFDRMMARLDVELSFRNEFATTPTVTSVTTLATKTGVIDYLSGIITTTGTTELYNLPQTKANESYSSVIIPQTVQKITVTIDGKSYIYTHPQPLALNKGKVQIVKLIVGRNRIELDQITIGDWGSQVDIEGGEAVD